MWEVFALDNGERHVIPADDLYPHEGTSKCTCDPFDDDGIWVHNSFDGRERFERKERKPN
jgi:hypothetical protein